MISKALLLPLFMISSLLLTVSSAKAIVTHNKDGDVFVKRVDSLFCKANTDFMKSRMSNDTVQRENAIKEWKMLLAYVEETIRTCPPIKNLAGDLSVLKSHVLEVLSTYSKPSKTTYQNGLALKKEYHDTFHGEKYDMNIMQSMDMSQLKGDESAFAVIYKHLLKDWK